MSKRQGKVKAKVKAPSKIGTTSHDEAKSDCDESTDSFIMIMAFVSIIVIGMVATFFWLMRWRWDVIKGMEWYEMLFATVLVVGFWWLRYELKRSKNEANK